MRAITVLILLLACTACMSPARAPSGSNDANVIGRIDTVTGQPAVIHNAKLANIGPRSAIRIGDTVLVNPRGAARIRMTDGTLFDLRDDAQITIQQYSRDAVVIICSAGSAIVDPGRYARQQSHEFTITTPLATVAARKGKFWFSLNTERIEVILLEDGELRVSNHLGEQVLSARNESSVASFIDPPSRQLAQSLPD